MHLEALQEKDPRCRQNQTLLWKLHVEQFTQWVKDKVYVAVDMEQLHNLTESRRVEVGSTSEVNTDVYKGGRGCQILDWCVEEEVVIGEGEFVGYLFMNYV